METKKIDTILFDYGNTIVLDPFLEILKRRVEEFKEVLYRNGYHIEPENMVMAWIEANKEVHYPFISHFYQEMPIIKQALKKINVNDQDIQTVGHEILQIYRQGFAEFLDRDIRRIEVRQTLAFFKNKSMKLGVLSNEREHALTFALECYKIIDLFDLILSSERVGIEKPDPKIFYYALEALHSSVEKTVYVGDDFDKDILPAKRIGMEAILYIPPSGYAQDMPWRNYRCAYGGLSLKIDRFSDLIRIFF